jgi:hypothetical protein
MNKNLQWEKQCINRGCSILVIRPGNGENNGGDNFCDLECAREMGLSETRL